MRAADTTSVAWGRRGADDEPSAEGAGEGVPMVFMGRVPMPASMVRRLFSFFGRRFVVQNGVLDVLRMK